MMSAKMPSVAYARMMNCDFAEGEGDGITVGSRIEVASVLDTGMAGAEQDANKMAVRERPSKRRDILFKYEILDFQSGAR